MLNNQSEHRFKQSSTLECKTKQFNSEDMNYKCTTQKIVKWKQSIAQQEKLYVMCEHGA